MSERSPYNVGSYVLERCNGETYAPAVATLGANVKRARIRAGYKVQGAAADALDWPQPRLSDVENDRYGALDLDTLLHLATTFNTTLDELVIGQHPDYDANRLASSVGKSGVTATAGTDREVLMKLLELWPHSTPQAHIAALTVLEAYPPLVRPPTDPQQETESSAATDPTTNKNRGRQQGA